MDKYAKPPGQTYHFSKEGTPLSRMKEWLNAGIRFAFLGGRVLYLILMPSLLA